MNLFSRLYSLLRAYAAHGRGESPFGHEGGNRQSYQQYSGDRYQHTPPEVDEELAGYYANLEVPYGSDLATVRAAWKRLVRKYHPDLHSADPEKVKIATEIVKGLNRAYEALEKELSAG
ncbi:MAG TPA: hypothetical protein ENJ29_15385 [Bacteroidetes bacterium]|nr:hypothetical protein [Bacteroidota bacterium]